MKKTGKNMGLAQLNSKQKQAVELLDTPVIVLAGPGTGKTKLLTNKIAYILQATDAKPDEILALTFTESAATNMRTRLSKLIGSSAYDVNIFTFHGFANYLINYYEDEYFQDIAGFRIISELEQVQILKDILSDSKLELKHLVDTVNTYYQIANIRSQLEEVKRENVTLEKLKQIIEIEKQVLNLLPKESPTSRDGLTQKYKDQRNLVVKLEEFYLVYKEYEKALKNLKLLDFTDLINIVIEKMHTTPEFLQSLQERFQYILVDEYQDTNTSQNKLVFEIAKYWQDKANILVVGDDDQAIYRFQGASVKNLLEFVENFKGTASVVLDTNYRSLQKIIDAASDVAQNIHLRINKHLDITKHFKAGNKDLLQLAQQNQLETGVFYDEFENQLDELNFIVEKIKKLLKQGIKPNEIAILVRQNNQLDTIMHILKLNKIKFVKYGGIDIFERPLIQQFLDYLKLLLYINDPKKSEALFVKVMHFKFNNISSNLILKLRRAFNQFKQDVKDKKLQPLLQEHKDQQNNMNNLTLFAESSPLGVLKNIDDLTFFDFLNNKELHEYLSLYGVSLQDIEPVYEFLDKLANLSSAQSEYNLLRFIHKVFKDSGLADYLLTLDTKLDEVSAFGVLFEHIKTLVLNKPDIDLQEFLDILKLFKDYNLRLEAYSYYIPDDAIRLITVHKAKGLEFDYVFMPFLSSSVWEAKRSGGKLLKLPDYVYSVHEITPFIVSERAEFLKLSKAKQEKLKPANKILKEDDERRAFYVGLTRARYGVFLTFSKFIVKNGKLSEQTPSRFILEIKDEHITKRTHKPQQAVDNEILLSLLEPSPTYYLGITVNDLEYIQQVVNNLTFSSTMLTDFLEDPQHFYLRYVLKLPSASALHMSYGNAYHYALQKTLAYYKKFKKMPDLEYAHKHFTLALAKEPINSAEFKRLASKAQKELYYYFRDRLQNYKYVPLYLENTAIVRFNGENLLGKLDKVELVSSGHNALEEFVQIVDYKTGQKDSLNDVLGKTNKYKKLRGFITKKAFQLYFYKLVFDLNSRLNMNGKYIAKWGVLDFTKVPKNQPYLPKPVILEFDNMFYEEFKKFVLDVIKEIKSLEWVKKLDVAHS